MKSKRTIKHRIEQRTANRKNARQRKRYLFRLEVPLTKKQLEHARTSEKEMMNLTKEN